MIIKGPGKGFTIKNKKEWIGASHSLPEDLVERTKVKGKDEGKDEGRGCPYAEEATVG